MVAFSQTPRRLAQKIATTAYAANVRRCAVDDVVETRSATIAMLTSVFRVRSERMPAQEDFADAAHDRAARSVIPLGRPRMDLGRLGGR